MGSESTGQLALVCVVAVALMTLYGVAALWAVGCRAGWLWRIAPLALLLAAWVPAGAYELLAAFGTQTVVVVGVVLLTRLMRRVRKPWRRSAPIVGQAEASTNESQRRFRFGLVDVAKAVVLVAAVLTIIRLHAPSTAVSLSVPVDAPPWCASGVGAGLVTLAAAYLVCGHPNRWYVRVIVFVVLTTVGGMLEMFIGRSQLSFQLVDRPPPPWILLCGPVQALLTTAWLLLLRGAGWAWWGDAVSTVDRRRRFGTRAIRVGLGGLSLCGIMLLGHFYWHLLPPTPIAVEPLPDPNAYDEIARLGEAIDWTAIPGEDVEAASVSACRTFVQDNAERLAAMRHALEQPCRNPANPNSPSYLTNLQIEYASVRQWSKALEAEAKVALADKRPVVAMQCDLETIRLSQSMAVGGLADAHLVSNSTEGYAQSRTIELVDDLDAPALETLVRELEARDASREPLSAVLTREQHWRRMQLGWPGRLRYWTEVTLGLTNSSDRASRRFRTRVEARSRLLIAECTVRRYEMTNGSPPESLESLVPEYLSAVPQDPYGDGPLVYRRTPDGYLLYSVAANGTDDGGQRVSFKQADYADPPSGDLFFDVKWDSP